MNVKQAAEYLQLNEKKVYALLNEGNIPATKVTGKWLFPRHLVDQWLVESSHGGILTDRLILTGSDDPLLHRLTSKMADELQDKAYILYTPTGTRLGLSLLAQRRANVCALHWGPVNESHLRHPGLLRHFPQHHNWVLLRLFRREQGLMVSPRLNVHTRRLRDLLAANYRWVLRQEGAGSQRFLEETLSLHNTALSDLNICERAYSEREAAALITMGRADISPGIRGGAAEFGLNFISIGWEAFDLALYRDVYFRALFQRFVKQLESPYIQSLAEALGGYDLRELGELVESA